MYGYGEDITYVYLLTATQFAHQHAVRISLGATESAGRCMTTYKICRFSSFFSKMVPQSMRTTSKVIEVLTGLLRLSVCFYTCSVFGAQQYSVTETSFFPKFIRRGKHCQRTSKSINFNISMPIRESENSVDNKYGKSK